MRVPISAKVVANLISTVGTNRLLTFRFTFRSRARFFDIPVDNIYGSPILISDMWKKNIQILLLYRRIQEELLEQELSLNNLEL